VPKAFLSSRDHRETWFITAMLQSLSPSYLLRWVTHMVL